MFLNDKTCLLLILLEAVLAGISSRSHSSCSSEKFDLITTITL